ncbi:hypothetical protein EMIT0P201_10923 [Pseudomonas chlororaphis]
MEFHCFPDCKGGKRGRVPLRAIEHRPTAFCSGFIKAPFTPAVASLLAVRLGCPEEGLGKRVTTGLSLNANFAY